MQPLDLSCPSKKETDLSPLCLKKTISSHDSSPSLRRFSGGSDDMFVTSTETRGDDSDSDQPQDLTRDDENHAPARKRFLSKFFKDPKGKGSLFCSFIQNSSDELRYMHLTCLYGENLF